MFQGYQDRFSVLPFKTIPRLPGRPPDPTCRGKGHPGTSPTDGRKSVISCYDMQDMNHANPSINHAM